MEASCRALKHRANHLSIGLQTTHNRLVAAVIEQYPTYHTSKRNHQTPVNVHTLSIVGPSAFRACIHKSSGEISEIALLSQGFAT